jgi:hypothetical protein
VTTFSSVPFGTSLPKTNSNPVLIKSWRDSTKDDKEIAQLPRISKLSPQQPAFQGSSAEGIRMHSSSVTDLMLSRSRVPSPIITVQKIFQLHQDRGQFRELHQF